jgi:AraC-like DNA-binding protein
VRQEKPSSYTGNMMVICQALQSYGLDANEVLELSGIDPKLFEKTNRIPAELMDQLICLAYEKTEDPAFGLRCAECLNPANFHALGMGLLCSSSLRDCCLRLERFFALITTLETVEFTETDEWARVSMSPITVWSEHHRNYDADIFTGNFLQVIRLIYRPDYCPAKVELSWTPPESYHDQYRNHFGCEIEFSAPRVAIYFDKQDLDVALPASNAELARQNDQIVMEFLGKSKLDLPSQVYTKLIELLPSGVCSRDRVAKSLHMSVSTFHEKLKKAGTNYQQLLDQTRKELAEQYISQADISLSEISYLLGFTDSSSFSRAFKCWFGVSPRAFRNNLSRSA